jgi:hypothetical protein
MRAIFVKTQPEPTSDLPRTANSLMGNLSPVAVEQNDQRRRLCVCLLTSTQFIKDQRLIVLETGG